jgi:hypothetical protein
MLKALEFILACAVLMVTADSSITDLLTGSLSMEIINKNATGSVKPIQQTITALATYAAVVGQAAAQSSGNVSCTLTLEMAERSTVLRNETAASKSASTFTYIIGQASVDPDSIVLAGAPSGNTSSFNWLLHAQVATNLFNFR